jgi:hypothetical protein
MCVKKRFVQMKTCNKIMNPIPYGNLSVLIGKDNSKFAYLFVQ